MIHHVRLSRATAAVTLLLLIATALQGQDLRILDQSGFQAATYDWARARTIAIGYSGETLEFDGSVWRIATTRHTFGPSIHTMAYDPTGRRTLLASAGTFGATAIDTWIHDGLDWQQVTPATTPPPRGEFVLEHDIAAGIFVLFGGAANSSLLADTWTFDGSNWSQRSPANSPGPRFRAGSAYDLTRSRIVIFGGQGPVYLDETWEWDGSNWARAVTPNQPAPRIWPQMTFDSRRNRTVLTGGSGSRGPLPNQVWEFDGTTWLPITPQGSAPALRFRSTMVFDETMGEALLVGGQSNVDHFDTWSWNGARWLQRSAAQPPNRSFGNPILAEPGGGDTVIRMAGTPANPSTFRFDGNSWSDLGVQPPSLRSKAASCTGPNLAYVFGGFEHLTGLQLGDFWGWDGTSWSALPSGANGPGSRNDAAMTYDLANNEVVLFGGSDSPNSVTDETWTFDGVSWTLHNPTPRPGGRGGHSMTFDLGRARTILFGGWNPGGRLNDTWEWDGSTWTPVTTTTPAPTPSARGQLVFDQERSATTLVAGRIPVAWPSPLDAWTLDAQGWNPVTLGQTALGGFMVPDAAVGYPYTKGVLLSDSGNSYNLYSLSINQAEAAHYGTACTANAPEVAANEWPRVGTSSFGIDVTRAPGSSLVALLGAVQSANVNVLGCTQLVQPGQAIVLLPTAPTGFANAPIPIPASPTFVGVDLFFQAAALDATAQNGFTLSRGLQITIGN